MGHPDGHIFTETLDLGAGPMTVIVKDSIDVAGIPTRQGSRLLADVPPAAVHAEVVERLLANGCWRIVGKANMHEFAFGVTGVNEWAGTPVNPRWPDRIPGGSSSGSAAAVAVGLVDAALGTDTGGSVRMPAACCGVVGFKPSMGLVSRRGAYPIASSLDCIGPFAQSVAMIERVMAAIAPGFVPVDHAGRPRLAVLTPDCDSAVAQAVAGALDRSGAERIDARLYWLEEAFAAGLVIIGAENWAAIGHFVDLPGMGEDVRGRLRAGGRHGAAEIAGAETVRSRFAAEVDALLDRADAIALPTLPIVPPTLEEAADARACVPLTRFERPFNLSGHPAITLPLVTAQGLPAGLQLVGRRGADAALCGLAKAVSRRLDLEKEEA